MRLFWHTEYYLSNKLWITKKQATNIWQHTAQKIPNIHHCIRWRLVFEMVTSLNHRSISKPKQYMILHRSWSVHVCLVFWLIHVSIIFIDIVAILLHLWMFINLVVSSPSMVFGRQLTYCMLGRHHISIYCIFQHKYNKLIVNEYSCI